MNERFKQNAQVTLRETGGLAFGGLFVFMAILGAFASRAETPAAVEFRREVQPVLKEYCYDCHGDGSRKGNVAFDELTSDETLFNRDLWFKVLKNTRAGLMPPRKKPRPSRRTSRSLSDGSRIRFSKSIQNIPIRVVSRYAG